MNDHIDRYKERVRKRLCRREDDSVERVAEALCFPSFHPETLLRATSGPAGTRFRLMTLSSSLWFSQEGTTERPERFQEVCAVFPDSALRFWRSMEELKPETIRAVEAIGADGMAVEASYRQGEASVTFETWCPDPASPPGRFIHLIYALAWEVLKEHVSIERLEQLHGYLHLKLPARVISAEVTCLRLFGGLASYHQQELLQLFDSIPTGTPLVVDMTNFDGMGTLLYPTFVKFASTGRLIAWAASLGGKRHLEAMRLPSPQIFERTQDAIEWVRQQANRAAGTV